MANKENKEKKLTVGDLKKILNSFKRLETITDQTEVWLASDEEGNSYSPLMRFSGGMVNIGLEDDKSRLTLYPSSTHSE